MRSLLAPALPILVFASSVATGQQAPPRAEVIRSRGNPILADGRYYSADPAPLVVDDTLYILAGRDEAPADVTDFIMKEWQLLATTDPSSGEWRHYPAVLRPENVFRWAEPARAYASQIVKGVDGRFYLYAPVLERDSPASDRFAIGVAVANSPLGPWTDAHPSGPIVSQRTPVPNDLQNIDPTVLVDDDKRIYLYWGTFGKMRGMELAHDMVTPKGSEIPMEGVTGFFEAPWIMKRRSTYYMIYAANKAGSNSSCTPTWYHACQAYATASSPLGPWTYRGVLMRPVSSTTSHAGIVEFKGKWYIAYHTADAKGGDHFRRSVALDQVEWDDSVSPAAIRLVRQTHAPSPAPAPTRNVAPGASITVSNEPVPNQYYVNAINDGKIHRGALPPDMWATWVGPDANPAASWIEYRWPTPVKLNGSRIYFWADQPAEAAEGIAPPKSWHLEYWDEGWKPVVALTPYVAVPGAFQSVRFRPVTTRCLRVVFDASGRGKQHAGMAVQEWEALRPSFGSVAAPPRQAARSCASKQG